MGNVRRHFLPTVEQQIALGIAQSGIAYRTAQRQAAMGVDPDIAVPHAVSVSTWVVSYALAVVPVAFFALLFVMSGNPFLFLWGAGCLTISMVLAIRLQKYVITPADKVIRYAIPTWAIVVAGGLWNCLLVFGLLFSVFLGVRP